MVNFNLEYIQERRKELNIPLQDMAIGMGFRNASTYLKYERGEYSFKANQLPKLAKLLKCRVSNFFEVDVAKTTTSIIKEVI
jgi:transcriptional regulator with XRE-family HTH domain